MGAQIGDGVVRPSHGGSSTCSGNWEGRGAFRLWEAVGSFVDHWACQQSLRRNVSGAEQEGRPGQGKACQGEAISNAVEKDGFGARLKHRVTRGRLWLGEWGGRSWSKLGLKARLQSLDLILRAMRRSRRISGRGRAWPVCIF